MADKKERQENVPEATEIEDSKLDQVSGGFLRKIESKITPAGTDGKDNENGEYNS